MIRVQGLCKSFDQASRPRPVLRGVDLSVERGQFLAVMGRSGSGKSTLLNLVAGLEVPDAGLITVGGTELTALDDRARTVFRRDQIGIVFQFFNLLPVLDVLDNVALPGLLAARPRGEVERRARELLARVGMEDRAEDYPDRLSGGEQQRVATARALINDPAVVLADEPTGNLDSENAERTLGLLAELAERDGQTILMATHDPFAGAHAGRVVTLVEGRIVDADPRTAVSPSRGPGLEGHASPAEGHEAARGGRASAPEGRASAAQGPASEPEVRTSAAAPSAARPWRR